MTDNHNSSPLPPNHLPQLLEISAALNWLAAICQRHSFNLCELPHVEENRTSREIRMLLHVSNGKVCGIFDVSVKKLQDQEIADAYEKAIEETLEATAKTQEKVRGVKIDHHAADEHHVADDAGHAGDVAGADADHASGHVGVDSRTFKNEQFESFMDSLIKKMK
jgi:hypothetical protein